MPTGPYYRGGSSLKPFPHEVRYNPTTGLLRTTHGVSIWDRQNGLERFGGAYKVKYLPPELAIIQRGRDPHHFEIVPAQEMTFVEYDLALSLVVLSKV